MGFVKDLMKGPVRSCRAEQTLHDAAHLMWEYDIGALPVVDNQEKVVGMITDRDIAMSAYLNHRPLWQIRIGTAMSSTVVSCSPETPVSHVGTLMSDYQVRRLPVVDGNLKLVGLISLTDLALTATSEETPVGGASRRVVAEILAACSQPRLIFEE